MALNKFSFRLENRKRARTNSDLLLLQATWILLNVHVITTCFVVILLQYFWLAASRLEVLLDNRDPFPHLLFYFFKATVAV